MRVAVLGASGFLGRHVLPELTRAGHSVRAVARNPPAAAANVEPLAGDVTDAGFLARALAGADACVNLVGIHHGHGPQSFERIHVELARRMVATRVPRIVQVSVLCARPDARLGYHDSKFRGDELIRTSDLRWTILRPAIVYGPDDAFTARINQMAKRGAIPIPGRGEAAHAPVHVDDVAQAVERALARPETERQILPLCGLRTLSYAEIVRELAARSGHRVWTPHFPLWFMRLAARATAWMASPPISAGQLAMITEGMAADTRPSWRSLGLEPRGFSAPHPG